MTERTRKIIGLFLIAGAAIAFGLAIYFLLFRGTPTITDVEDVTEDIEFTGLETSEDAGERPSSEEEEEASGGLQPSEVADGGPTLTVQLTSSAIVSPTLSGGDEVVFYDPSDGGFYTIDSNGNLIRLGNRTFPSAETVVFSNTAEKAALEFPDGSNIIYDLITGDQTTLPAHWEDFDFSADGQAVATKSLALDPYARSLVVTSTDGTSARAIASLGLNEDDVNINWSPNNQIVAFSETGSAQSSFGRQEIFLIDQNGSAVGAIVVEGTNFSAIWSPSGNAILYSIADTSRNDRPSLWWVQASGNTIGNGRTELGVESWVEKCTFKDESTILCGIPREVVNFSGFDHRLITSGDDLYEINLNTGRTSLLAELTTEMKMFNLSVSDDGSLLYFTDAVGRLNSLRLR